MKGEIGPEELSLLKNDQVFLLKQKLSVQLIELLGQCGSSLQAELNDSGLTVFPEAVIQSTPKISRGENYLGRPWTLLDYPRVFGKPDIFAFRTLCWWGQGFGCTLHLGGAFAQSLGLKLASQTDLLSKKGFSMGIHPDPWMHAFGTENYRPLRSETNPGKLIRDFIQEHGFLKLHRFLPLDDYRQLNSFAVMTWRGITDALQQTTQSH